MDRLDYNNIDQRVDEIKTFVTNDNINQATKRVMDLTKEFIDDRKLENEAIVFRQKFIELNTDKRKLGHTKEIDTRQTEFIHNILEFVDVIKDSTKQDSTKNETPEKRGIETEILKKKKTSEKKNEHPEGQGNGEKLEKKLTRFEVRRKKFTQEKGSIPNIKQEEFICIAKGLNKEFTNNKNFKLSDISLKMKLREITGVVGENGNGKTTILKIIAGELAADEGEIRFPLLNRGKLDWYRVKQQMAYIPQKLNSWVGSLKNNLHFSASVRGIKGVANQEEVDFIVYRLGLEEYLSLYWDELSGGYQTRFELARMLVWKPKLLVLDEPLANLDINAQIIFLQDLRDLAKSIKNPISIIVSSQHLHEIESIADKIMFLEDGKIKYYGDIDNLGKEREINSFELSGNYSGRKLTRDLLYNIFCDIDIKDIEDIDMSLIIHTPLEIKAKDILEKIFKETNISLNYFRNISTSTRSLFRKKY